MRHRAGRSSLAAALLVGGCAAAPPLSSFSAAQTAALPAHYAPLADGTAMAEGKAAAADLARWWLRFDDPALTRLAERTLVASQDIAQAAARVAEARAGYRVAGAARLPTLTVGVDATRTLSRPSSAVGAATALDGALTLNWDPDLFGGLASGHRASRAAWAAAGYDLATVQRAAVAEVVASYIAYRGLSARIANAERALADQQDLLDVIRHRAASGIAVDADVEQARLQLLQVRALLPALGDARNQAASRIAVLAGQSPGDLGDLLGSPSPTLPMAGAEPPTGVPVDLLRRRPDILAAEQRVIAAGQAVGVARAALLPKLSLGGVVSAAAFSLPSLVGSLVSAVVGSISQTLFDGGGARATVQGRRAAAREAVAAYRATVLAAMENVADAFSATRADGERVRVDAQALDAAGRNAALTRGRYDIGLVDLFILLDAEQQLQNQRDALIVAQTDRATAMVQLYVALGGGWES